MNGHPLHLVVGTPCYGGKVYSAFFTSLFKLQEACWRKGISFTFLMIQDEALIQRARQELVGRFLEIPDATHLLFVDADIGFEPEQAFRLLEFNADVTAALYPLKVLDWEKVKKRVLASDAKPESSSLSYVCGLKRPGQVRDWFARANDVGNGFLMVRRPVWRAMMEHYPELRYNTAADGAGEPPSRASRYALFNCLLDEATQTYLPEDYSFCRRWTQMGGEIWVDMRSRLDHYGTARFRGDTFSQGGTASEPAEPLRDLPPGTAPP